MSRKSTSVAAIAIVAGLTLSNSAVGYLVDWLWFSSLGYREVFWAVFGTRLILFLTVLGITALLIVMNGWLASRLASQGASRQLIHLVGEVTPSATPPGPQDFLRKHTTLLVSGSALVTATFVGAFEMANWDALRFVYQVPYGQRDPVFGNDIGFYLFSLPAYIALKNWMLLTVSLSYSVAAVYWTRDHIEFDGQSLTMSPTAIGHGSVLLGVFFAVKAWSYGLDRYLLLYGDNGVVVGAGYTDRPRRAAGPVAARSGLRSAAPSPAWANMWPAHLPDSLCLRRRWSSAARLCSPWHLPGRCSSASM